MNVTMFSLYWNLFYRGVDLTFFKKSLYCIALYRQVFLIFWVYYINNLDLVSPLPPTCCLCPTLLQAGRCFLACWWLLLGHLAASHLLYLQLLLFLQQHLTISFYGSCTHTGTLVKPALAVDLNGSTCGSPRHFCFMSSRPYLNRGHSLLSYGKEVNPFERET